MREYKATEAGERLAAVTGLDVLTNKLINRQYNYYSPLLTFLTERPYGIDHDNSRAAVNEQLETFRSSLTSLDEIVAFEKAFCIEDAQAKWRYIGDWEQDTLLPVRSINQLAEATEEDSYILSGAVGFSLSNFRGQCPLLAKSRFSEYGFKTFSEACAFVGAYVVGKFVDQEYGRLKQKTPSFQYTKNRVTYSLGTGGTIHGDFEMTQSQLPSDILSPINTVAEFAPHQELVVLGYHSIEPEIVATLIEAEFLRSGKEQARQLVEEFIAVLEKIAGPEKTIRASIGNFGDYGQGDALLSLVSLDILLSDATHNPMRHNQFIHSTPYAPQSATMFEIVPAPTGVRFQNRYRNQPQEAVSGIELDREHYGAFFESLVQQTAGGLGRTAPSQLIHLVYAAQSLLDGKRLVDLYDY